MATVTELADRVCQVTGLATTGAERAIVLSALNQASDYAALEVGNYIATFGPVSLTADDGDYTLSAAPFSLTDLIELRQLWVTDASSFTTPLRQISETRMMRLRQGQSMSSTPQVYAVRGTRELLLWPLPASGTTISGSYLKAALVLVETGAAAGQETTPSWIPRALHYDVIANRAISIVLERENRYEDAAAYKALYEQAIERAAMWTSRFGGPTIDDDAVVYGFERDRDI